MEYSQTLTNGISAPLRIVLILILMEYSQTVLVVVGFRATKCLNPYSNGILTDKNKRFYGNNHWNVLILILMEYSQTEICAKIK